MEIFGYIILFSPLLIAIFFSHRLSGVASLFFCGLCVWLLSETIENDDVSPLWLGFLGLLYLMQYISGRDDYDPKIRQTGWKFFPATGQIVQTFSSRDNWLGWVILIIGMPILGILGGVLSGLRSGLAP